MYFWGSIFSAKKIGEVVTKTRRFLASEDGPTAVEYAVMLALIIIVCLVAIQSVGTQTNTVFTNVAGSISGS